MATPTADPLWLRRPGGGPADVAYGFAGGILLSDHPVPALADRIEPFDPPPPPEPFPEPLWRAEGEPRFADRVLLAETHPLLECRRRTHGPWDADLLQIDGAAALVARDGSAVEWRLDPDLDPALSVAWLHGPVLCLALARRGVFCLHAGAVCLGDDVVAWVGPSGIGKSTLARLLTDQGAEPVADDQLPVPLVSAATSESSPRVAPQPARFASPEPPVEAPSTRPLRAVYLLAEPRRESPDRIHSEPLSPAEAVTALLGQTVSASLFDAEIAARLLDTWARLAAQIPVRRLHYPRRLDVGPEILRHLLNND